MKTGVQNSRLAWRPALLILALAGFAIGAKSFGEVPRTIRVVMDNSYPPFVFYSSDGKLQGILIDQWQAWQKKTGIKVEIHAMDWGEALRRMRAGEFDVIDTIFDTPERRNIFDFTVPYASIEESIFFRKDISGITDLESLKGFPVAVKEGGHLADMLKTSGQTTVLLFHNYEAIVEAAKQGKVNVFMIDAPSALYFLNKLDIAAEFRGSPPVNVGKLSRAVRKGDTVLLRTVEGGFAAIGPDELKKIEKKWFGYTLDGERYLIYAGWAGATILLLIAGLVGWNRALSKRVGYRTLALRESENRFRTIFEHAGIGIALVGLTDGRIIRCNRSLAEMLGYSPDELSRLTVQDVSQAGDYVEDRERWEKMILDKTDRYQMEKRYRRKDGQLIWGMLTSTMVRDSDGRPLFIIGMVEAITERKRVEEALRASEKRFKALFDQAAVGVALADALTGRFVQVNRRFCEIVGRSSQELEQLTFPEITHPQDIALDLETMRQLKTGSVREFTREKRYLRKDRSEVWVNLTVSAMWAPDETPDCFIAIAKDITERKQLEEQFRQAQKMEAIGTLAGGIAHDFNNILTSIYGYTELAQLTLKENPEVREYLGAVLRASIRAADLVRQILAFSRQQPPERQLIQLQPVLEESLGLLRGIIPSTIVFDTAFATDVPTVLADTTQIHQILMNLGTNAWHAMRDRSGTLQVKLERCVVDEAHAAAQPQLRPGVYARVSVSDTGCGMDQATLRRVFEPFFTTKPQGEGTGLGLAVVHGIMDSHDGTATVYSRPGEGTVFHLYFPAHGGEAAAASPKEGTVPRGHGERILFVDDEEVLGQLGQKTLAALGYEVEFTTQSAAALAMVRADPQRFALVITDQAMPGMEGLVLASQLRQIRPELPIILTTGFSLLLTPERLEAAGIRQLLPKPITIHALGTAVYEALSAQPPH